MNFRLEHLNFLYIYNHCKEIKLDVSVYDNVSIEDIEREDVDCILKYFLYKRDILVSPEEILFEDKINDFIKKTDTENLSTVGASLNKEIQYIRKVKDRLSNLSKNTKDRNFIYWFDEIIKDEDNVKKCFKTLIEIKQNQNIKEGNNRNKKLVNFLFS